MGKKLPWLRLHTEIVDDPKLASFTGDEFRAWVYLLCLARESSVPGTIGMDASGIAWRTRMSVTAVTAVLDKCVTAGMVDHDGVTVRVCNWHVRQFEKPSAEPTKNAERQKRYREKAKSNAPSNADVTRVSRDSSVQSQIQSTEAEAKQNTASTSPVVVPTPEAAGLPGLVSTPAAWPSDLDPVRQQLERLQAPGDLFDPAYWRTVDEWLGKHPTVAYLDETAKYLAHEQGKNRRRQHKNHKSGLSNWLRVAERISEREAQKRQQWQQRR